MTGGKLKESDFTHWISSNNGATNESGFTALPGGVRYYYRVKGGTADGTFTNIGKQVNLWSFSNCSSSFEGTAFSLCMRNESEWIENNSDSNNFGFSFRCIKD